MNENIINNTQKNQNTDNNTADNQDATENKTEVQCIHSPWVAEQLCCYYPHFMDLLYIRKDKFKKGKRLWFFRRSEEFDSNFENVREEAKQRYADNHPKKDKKNG